MKVCDVCDLVNGRAFKPSDWGSSGLPIVRIQNLNNESAPFNYYSGEYNPAHEINDGELLFSWSGTPGTSFGAFRWYRGKGILNQHIYKVVPKIDIDKDYLKYALNGNLSRIISKAHGGVGLQHITKKELNEITLRIVSNDEQRKIVALLNQTQNVIDARRDQLAKLDELVKCRFVEMFGDWKTNPLNLPQISGKELFVFSSGKFLSTDKRKEFGVPVYGGNGIAWYTDKPLIQEPTIIIGRVGAFCGNIHSTKQPVWITDNAIYIKHCKKEIDHVFLTELMTQMNFHQYADFSGQPKITQKPLEETKYILPTLKQQNAFAAFVRRIDKLRFFVGRV